MRQPASLSVGDGPEALSWAAATGVLWGLSYFFWRRLQLVAMARRLCDGFANSKVRKCPRHKERVVATCCLLSLDFACICQPDGYRDLAPTVSHSEAARSGQ